MFQKILFFWNSQTALKKKNSRFLLAVGLLSCFHYEVSFFMENFGGLFGSEIKLPGTGLGDLVVGGTGQYQGVVEGGLVFLGIRQHMLDPAVHLFNSIIFF